MALAPTWAEMDAAVAACRGWHRDLVATLRGTGLRRDQAMRLRWGDVDLGEGLLSLRGERGRLLRKGQPFHAFRHGVITGLVVARAPLHLVRYLVGHKQEGVTAGVYTDWTALLPALREVVELIPPMGEG